MNPALIFSVIIFFNTTKTVPYLSFKSCANFKWGKGITFCLVNNRDVSYHSDNFTKDAKFLHCGSEDTLQQTDVILILYCMVIVFKP